MPTAPFLAIDRDGWLYGLASEADIAGELEQIDVAGGEYAIFDRDGRRVEALFEGRSLNLRLLGQQSHWEELRSTIDHFFRDHGLDVATGVESDLVIEAVKTLRLWGP